MLTNAGVWTGIILLLYSLVLFYQSFSFDYTNQFGPGPGFLPFWVSAIMIAVTLLYIWESAVGEKIAVRDLLPRNKNIGFMLGGLCIFALIVEFAGFIVSGSLLVFMMTIGKYKWHYAIPVSIVAAILVSVIFQKLLGVPLPANGYGW